MGEEEKKADETKAEEVKVEKPSEEKKTEDSKVAPPPPPQEIVLSVFMHCEGCARKVRRSLKGFEGVEDVRTDCRTHKVVVKGENADPLKVRDRVQAKSHRQVDLLSPIPKPPADDTKKPEEKELPKPQEKEEPQVMTVVLKVYMHCDACGQQLKRRIQRMKGVENAEPDMKSSQVTVKGVFDPPKLVQYVHKRTGKHALIVKQEPEKKAEEKAAAKEEKKAQEGDKEAKKGGEGEEKEKEAPKEKKEGGGGEAAKPEAAVTETVAAAEQEETKVVEVKKNESMYYYYPLNYHVHPSSYVYPPSGFAAELYSPYPPQIFSDENPNACSVM